MKIDRKYLANNIDNTTNRCKVCVEIPWNLTNLDYIYSHLDESLDLLEKDIGKVEIMETNPIHFDKTSKTMIIELVIDLTGIDLTGLED